MDSKDNILFWIDNVWSQFAFAKFLQPKCDANFYGIIDLSHKNKQFLQKQNFVDFRTTWDIRELQEKNLKQNLDFDYLSSFEKTYNINLWSIAYADRYFYKHNSYYNFNSDEILGLIQNTCKLYDTIFAESKPDFLIAYPFNDFRQEILFKMCIAKKVRILTLNFSRINYRFMISERSDKSDLKFDYKSYNKTNPKKSFEQLYAEFQNYPKAMYRYIEKKNVTKGKFSIAFYFFSKVYEAYITFKESDKIGFKRLI